MADNKEITTLHPYMNRNKNRYPNVREENIPDTIQRKLTAGTGISISPENVISATGGDSYTRSETDALLDTKADKVALENVNKVVPTDIAVKNGKLGLEHDTTWLTNQNAITLGDGLTYDEATKTLKAEGSGATLPAGTKNDPFRIQYFDMYAAGDYGISFTRTSSNEFDIYVDDRLYINASVYASAPNISLSCSGLNNAFTQLTLSGRSNRKMQYYVRHNNESGFVYVYIPALADPTSDGIYNLQFVKSGSSYLYQWDLLKKTYNHYIVISDGTSANAIYLLIPSTNNLKCNSLTDLNTLLGTAQRFIQASGVVTGNASKLPIVAINWQGSFSSSKIVTMSSEEATTKFTNVVDVVEPA